MASASQIGNTTVPSKVMGNDYSSSVDDDVEDIAGLQELLSLQEDDSDDVEMEYQKLMKRVKEIESIRKVKVQPIDSSLSITRTPATRVVADKISKTAVGTTLDKDDLFKVHSSFRNQLGSRVVQRFHNVDPPVLKSTSKYDMKTFIINYRAYQKYMLSYGESIKPQDLIDYYILEEITYYYSQDMDALANLPSEEFFRVMVAIHGQGTKMERLNILNQYRMKSDNLSIDGLIAHNRDFDFEVLVVAADELLGDKELSKVYIRALRPNYLSNQVKSMFPNSLREAKLVAREVVLQYNSVAQVQKTVSYNKDRYEKSVTNSKVVDSKISTTINNNNNNNNNKSSSVESSNKVTATKPVQQDKKARDMATVQCYYCQAMGHLANNCPQRKKDKSANGNKKAKDSTSEEKVATARSAVSLTESDLHGSADEFIRVDARLIESPEVDHDRLDLFQSVFLDPGAHINTISQSFLDQTMKMIKVEVENGSPTSITGVGDLTLRTTGKIVWLYVKFLLEVPVVVHLKFHVLQECRENIAIGINAIKSAGLADYVHGHLTLDIAKEEEIFNSDDVQMFPVKQSDPIDTSTNTTSSTTSDVYIDEYGDVIAYGARVDINPSFPELDKLKQLLVKYAPTLFSDFDDKGMFVEPMEIKLKPGAQFKTQPCRYISPKLLKKVKAEIDKLVKMGILVRAGVTPVASPLVVVPKPDDEIRLAVDFRQLNENIIPVSNQLPYMKTFFVELGGNKYYALMDNLFGYYQLLIAESSQGLTAIITPWGNYVFTRCPFGVSIAPGVYQNIMSTKVLKDLYLNGVLVYIDDTIVYGKTVDEFLLRLEGTLKAMSDYNVRLKLKKCRFGYEEVRFLGHIFNENGVTLGIERKQGINDMPVPATLKQLRSFLGMVNYFRDFIPNLSVMLHPLTDLTKTSSKFTWTAEANDAFIEVKQAVMSAQGLGHLNDVDPLYLYTDASTIGCGATLFQLQNDVMIPIVFLSTKFSSAATKWATIKQECYGVFWAVMKLSSYLLGRHFYIYTDHKNLVYLTSSNIPQLVRWRLRLQEYQYTILHIEGKRNVVADGLSRVFYAKEANSLDDITPEQAFRSVHNCIVGHHGINKTIQILEKWGVNWPYRKDDIKLFISRCPICQKVKYNNQVQPTLPLHFLHGNYPMESLSVDTIGPLPVDEDDNKYILVIIDNFSKYSMLYAIHSTEAHEYVRNIIQYFGIFGVCQSIRSDGGTQFTAGICSDLSTLLDYKHLVIVPYHPQANGIVERRNAEVMKHLRALVMEKRVTKKWSLYLPLIQRILNSTFDSSIGTSPSKIIFGDMLPVDVPFIFKGIRTDTNVSDYLKHLTTQQNHLIDISKSYLEKQRLKRLNGRVEESSTESPSVGDYVLISYPNKPPSKLSPLYRGPLIIVNKERDDIVTCRDLITDKIFDVHINRVHLYQTGDNVTPTELLDIASFGSDQVVVDSIISHKGKSKKDLQFLLRWLGLDSSEDQWKPFKEVKDLAALDAYLEAHPDLAKLVNGKGV
eukprot:CAMPEP_0196762882 /NCGR_PEP_ID=MMETSP1095-20130614/3014_1 /TAXON_ID=96789 ORGANISM="Chromulina nebulosa, Strain UTEXLB2642" /NCGR_SAMPLE_ID=MMETSP1095 /ASSEMBLY_ACC=CAM_ASM_000446 /LENGTH=1512 /DNA_ID=CAMNT_0042114961 /DNA_START=95 /DNA_END=4633 /DNA_ORIENTATION=-